MGTLDAIPAELRSRARKAAQPRWVQPMLATLSGERDLGKGLIFERKLDGIRALAFKRGKEVALLSRNKLDLAGAYPGVVAALRAQRGDFIVDGEVVGSVGRRSGFEVLQQRRTLGARVRITYNVFDVVQANGYDVTGLPLTARKGALRALLTERTTIKITKERKGSAESLLARACAAGWEGLIAKRADSMYQHGRSRDWLKLKCSAEQEFVVGGFTDPKGSRQGFGALLLGVYEDGSLRYAGEVGTGFSNATLRELRARLDELEQPTSTFSDFAKPRKGVHWVKPRLVAQVAFSEWTRDGRLRHPRFLGLRTDKRARDVVREKPA